MTGPESRNTVDAGEVQRVKAWIEKHGAPGQPCDGCGLPLVGGERSSIATAETCLGHLLFVVCERCTPTGAASIRSNAERLMDRFVSAGAAELVMMPKESVN